MEQIGEIMEDIRDMPVCPQSGEINLYCIIKKNIEDGNISEVLRQRCLDGSRRELRNREYIL